MVDEENIPLSKTKLKQLAKEVEKLAAQMTGMGNNQFAQLEIPKDIREETVLARETVGRGSHKRQIKHLAGLLRKQPDIVENLQRQLEELDQVARSEKSQFHQLEELRDQLCQADQFQDAFEKTLTMFPELDRNTIRRLARSVHQHSDKRASREIFRRLRDEAEKS
jgi:ribosome-associated protein